MRASLWWIPGDRIRELSASDLAVLRMCRVLTVFLAVATVYFTVLIVCAATRSECKLTPSEIQSSP